MIIFGLIATGALAALFITLFVYFVVNHDEEYLGGLFLLAALFICIFFLLMFAANYRWEVTYEVPEDLGILKTEHDVYVTCTKLHRTLDSVIGMYIEEDQILLKTSVAYDILGGADDPIYSFVRVKNGVTNELGD